MAITPSDIEKKTFSTALRGYDLDEVDDFLDEMVVAVRELNDELIATKARLAEIENDPDALAAAPAMTTGPDESAVGRALVTAQQTADRMLEDARSEADKIVRDARSEADTFARERDERKAAVDAEMAEMTGLVAGVRTQLAVLATTVADKLDEMDAVVAGAHSSQAAPAAEDAGPGNDTDVAAIEDEDVFDGDEEGGVDSDVSDGEQGFEVDLEDLDEEDEGDPAGSAEIEGVESGEEGDRF